MTSLRLPSYAKINLHLEIKGKRDDGYHEIASLFQQVDLKDDIELVDIASEKIVFLTDAPHIPSDETNLCVRATRLYLDTIGAERGVEIRLTKRIPAGAGLGGGSSNAAVVLLGLNALWGDGLKISQLRKMAEQLGSDVPFFISGGMAEVRGRGEVLSHFDSEFSKPVMIVFPGIQIASGWAYQQLNLSLTKKNNNLIFMSFNDKNFNKVGFYHNLRNEFETVVFKNYPILREIKHQILQRNPLYASLSGSGSALFGVFNRIEEALQAGHLFGDEYATFITRPIKWGYKQLCESLV